MLLWPYLSWRRGGGLWPASAAIAVTTGMSLWVGATQILVWHRSFDSAVYQVIGVIMYAAFVLALTTAVAQAREARDRADRLVGAVAEAHEELRQYSERVHELAVAEERTRMARELHDSVGHYLTVIKVGPENAERFRFGSLRAGARGFLLQDASPETLVAAIRMAAQGGTVINNQVTGRVVARLDAEDPPTVSPSESLSAREEEVAWLVATGASNQEIAAKLYLSEGTRQEPRVVRLAQAQPARPHPTGADVLQRHQPKAPGPSLTSSRADSVASRGSRDHRLPVERRAGHPPVSITKA